MVQGPTQQESGSKGGRYIFLGSRTSGEGRVLAVDYSKDMTAEEQKRYINYLAERKVAGLTAKLKFAGK